MLYLGCDGSELVVAVQVELSAVGVAAEVQRLIPVDGEAKNAQEEHPHRAEEQGVELAYHGRRPELEHTHTQVRECEQHTHTHRYVRGRLLSHKRVAETENRL